MILISLPDLKFIQAGGFLTLGKDYPILRELGNGYVIQSDKEDTLLVLQSRFKETE